MTDNAQETLRSHLSELRARLVRSLVALGIVFIPTFFFASELYDLLAMPMMRTLPEGSKMIATGVITPFFIPMKIALMVAFLVALPYILYGANGFPQAAGVGPAINDIQLCDARGDHDTGGGVAAGRWIQIGPTGRPQTYRMQAEVQGNPVGGC